ncbi:MAG: hypothetical protein HN478_01030 [Rhodospirillaceae bacterium]|jgi:TfoX/Sxy family transcriptional regulator of competence genes|nr:hypothetical protein [Rhodospirillaceae bacterium]MBT4490155.1 hypothetical protein [Rhodospirillaceae bacterium]MBT5195284.1 hypothetical protein [Rhodospirillaceae bacterium]MBT5894347.1 hypothetical protein [Rhodospirillaceae bacterium]MBT6428978.1 hypothetical protein [Rhodospirillaceae bacterium]
MKAEFLQAAQELVAKAGIGETFQITYKSVFGAVAAYADGRIFLTCGKFGIALKLPEETCRSLIEQGHGEPLKYFEKGHVKKSYVVLFDPVLNDPERMTALTRQSGMFTQEID